MQISPFVRDYLAFSVFFKKLNDEFIDSERVPFQKYVFLHCRGETEISRFPFTRS